MAGSGRSERFLAADILPSWGAAVLRPYFLLRGGGVGGGGGVDVEEPGACGIAGDVTIAVGVIRGSAALGELLAPRRLRELPDGSIGDAAGGRRRRIPRHSASRRGWAGVVENPIGEYASFGMVANVVRGDDGDAATFVDGHAGAVHAGAVGCVLELIHPGAQ